MELKMHGLRKGIDGIFRPLLLCLVFVLGFLVWQPMATAKNRPAPVKEITVAVVQDADPFYFRDQKGVADGWLVDLWRLWAKKTGVKVKFVMVPFGETLRLTKAGKVDVQGGCFYNKERATYLDYVAPLIETVDTHFFFHKDNYGIETLKDLLGFRIGVIKGDFAVGYVQKHLSGASLTEYATYEALFKALEKGEIRVFVMDTPVGLYFLKKLRLLSSFRYYPDKPLYSNTMHAAVRKGDEVLPPVIKSGFDKISPEEKTQIKRRWIGSRQIKPKGVLTIACDRYYPPFTMLTPSGKAAGILVEIWRLWASKNLRAIDFVFGDWKDSIQMVKDGRADFHSGLYKTPERETFLSFSAPVFDVQDSLAFKTSQKPMMLAELSDARVGVIAGSGEEIELREQYPKIIRIPYKGYPELLTALQDGDVIAIYDVGVTLQRAIEDLGLQGEIRVSREATPARNLFAAVLKKDGLRLKSINSGLAEITEKEIRDVEARWVSNPDLRQYSGKARPMVLTFEEKEWLKKHPHIRLGVDPNFMPFEAFSSEGEYEGLSSSYVALMSKKLDVEMTPVKGLSWQDVMDAVKAGKLDVLPCVAKTPARMEFLQFTRPYLDFQTVAVTRKDAKFIADLNGLKDAKVAVVKGYFVQEMLEQDFPEMKLVLVDDIDQGLKAVAEGQAAAYVDNSASIVYAMSKLGLTDLKVAASTGYSSSLRFGVRKDWPQLATILDKALNSIPEEEKRNIANRWINVRFAERTDWAFLIKMGIAVAVVIGLILTIIIIWNRRMAKEMAQRKQAEERFQAIAATTPGAIIQLRFNDEGIPEYLYLSAKAEAFFGMPPEQVIKEKRRLQWHPEDRERMLEKVPRLTAAGEDLNLVGRIQPQGEETRWVRINASPSGSSEGNPIYSGFILDITERKVAEQEYLRSERKIKAMSQAAEDAMVMIDGAGKVLFWNPAAEKLFGFSQEEAMGMEFHQMAAPGMYHDKIHKGLKHFAHTGEGPVLGTTTEITARNREGREFPVEVTLSSFQVDDEWFAVGTVRDITERKKSEDRLKSTQTTVDKAALNIFWVDPQNGKFVYANEAACHSLGYTREELMGMHVPQIDVEFNEEKFAGLMAALKAHPQVDTEGVHRTKDGRLLNVSLAIVLTELENRQIIAVFARDETEKKKAEKALKESEQRVQTILNAINTGVIIIDPENRTIVDVNPVAARMIGLSNKEIIGQTCHQFICPKEMNDCPVLDNDQEIENAERVLVTAEGGEIPILKTVTRVNLGGKTHLMENFIDISERKKVEEAMRQAGNEQVAIFESLTLGIAFVKDRIILRGNRKLGELFGRPLDEMIGQTTRIWYRNEEEYLGIGASTYEDLKTKEVHQREQQLPRKDGSFFWCYFRVRAIDPNDISRGIVCILEDVTERKRAERELKERMEELERFNRLVVGREIKMIGLKEEVNQLLEKLGREEKYEIVQ